MSEEKVYLVWSPGNDWEVLIFIGIGVGVILCWLGFFDVFLPKKEKKLERIKNDLVGAASSKKNDDKPLSSEEADFYGKLMRYEHAVKEARTAYQVAKENLARKEEEFEALLYAEKKRRKNNAGQ